MAPSMFGGVPLERLTGLSEAIRSTVRVRYTVRVQSEVNKGQGFQGTGPGEAQCELPSAPSQ